MAEFGDVPPTVLGMANVVNSFPTTEEELGISALGLNDLLSAARSSNIHTKPPPAAEKIKKKLLERLQVSLHPSHLNTFLALQLYPNCARDIDERVLRGCLDMCVNNDPEWVHSCQLGALRMFYHELDAPSPRTPKPDDPVLLAQVRSTIQTCGTTTEIPRIAPSQCHFRFVVDTTMEESKDRYFSAQVKFKCESKGPTSVSIARRLSFVDGVAQCESTDFQCMIDRESVKKGDTTILMLSLIAKPFAVFHTIQEMLIVAFDSLPIVCTFLVINPCSPAFGTGVPAALCLPVTASPIGAYHAPLALQILKHQFVRQQGFLCKDVSHVLCGPSHMYTAQNRDVMRQANKILCQLDDAMDIGEALCSFWTSQGGGQKGGSHLSLPPSAAQPPGYQPAGNVPSGSQASLSTFPNVQTAVAEPLVAASPAVLFSLMLSWISMFPCSVVDASICQCDPIMYLESLQPWQQGIIRWVLDLCCGLLVHQVENEICLRDLALTFGSLFVHHELSKEGGLTSHRLEDDIEDAEMEVDRMSRRDDRWKRCTSLRHYAVTAVVHWLTLYEGLYTKAASK
jgi:hypothetical protein